MHPFLMKLTILIVSLKMKCVIEDSTIDPVLRAINKYKNQHGICNKEMNAGNSVTDN